MKGHPLPIYYAFLLQHIRTNASPVRSMYSQVEPTQQTLSEVIEQFKGICVDTYILYVAGIDLTSLHRKEELMHIYMYIHQFKAILHKLLIYGQWLHRIQTSQYNHNSVQHWTVSQATIAQLAHLQLIDCVSLRKCKWLTACLNAYHYIHPCSLSLHDIRQLNYALPPQVYTGNETTLALGTMATHSYTLLVLLSHSVLQIVVTSELWPWKG